MTQLRTIGSAEAAKVLKVSIRTLHRMLASGVLPSEKLPGATGAYVIERADVERLAAQGIHAA